MIEINFYIEVKAKKFAGFNTKENLYVYSGAFGVKGPITYEEADRLSNEFMDNLINQYEVEEVLKRLNHTECLIRKWDRSHDTTTEQIRFIVDKVYPNPSDSLKIKNSFIKFYNSAMIKLRDHNLLVPCSRCGGSGHYSKDRYGDTTCYKCKGFKYQLPRDSKKFRKSLEETFDSKPDLSYNNINNKKEGDVNMKLTTMEIKILNGMRNNEYNDALESDSIGTWSFTAIDNSGIDPKKARGVISSLVKKGLVTVHEGTHPVDDPETISFTEKGIELFENADGKECCWGGPRLLKENLEKSIDTPENIPYNNINESLNKEGEIEMKNINEMNVKELQGKAKELKVKNWWTLKKADLIKEIQLILDAQQPQVEEVKVEPVKEDIVKDEPKAEGNKFTLKMILDEIGMNGKKARRILRTAKVEKPNKQWEWDNEEDFNKIKGLLTNK